MWWVEEMGGLATALAFLNYQKWSMYVQGCPFFFFFLSLNRNKFVCECEFMAPQQKRKRRRIVKMKMNEEEGPGEYDHTEELVKAWKEAVLGNLLLQHSREKLIDRKTRLPPFTVNINVTQNLTTLKIYHTNMFFYFFFYSIGLVVLKMSINYGDHL